MKVADYKGPASAGPAEQPEADRLLQSQVQVPLLGVVPPCTAAGAAPPAGAWPGDLGAAEPPSRAEGGSRRRRLRQGSWAWLQSLLPGWLGGGKRTITAAGTTSGTTGGHKHLGSTAGWEVSEHHTQASVSSLMNTVPPDYAEEAASHGDDQSCSREYGSCSKKYESLEARLSVHSSGSGADGDADCSVDRRSSAPPLTSLPDSASSISAFTRRVSFEAYSETGSETVTRPSRDRVARSGTSSCRSALGSDLTSRLIIDGAAAAAAAAVSPASRISPEASCAAIAAAHAPASARMPLALERWAQLPVPLVTHPRALSPAVTATDAGSPCHNTSGGAVPGIVSGSTQSGGTTRRYEAPMMPRNNCPIGPRLASSRGLQLLLHTGLLSPGELHLVLPGGPSRRDAAAATTAAMRLRPRRPQQQPQQQQQAVATVVGLNRSASALVLFAPDGTESTSAARAGVDSRRRFSKLSEDWGGTELSPLPCVQGLGRGVAWVSSALGTEQLAMHGAEGAELEDGGCAAPLLPGSMHGEE